MNLFKLLCSQLFGVKKGAANYQAAINAGKVIAPVAQPLIENYLTSKGLPVSGEAALGELTAAAVSSVSALPAPIANGLADFIGQHISLVVPQPAP